MQFLQQRLVGRRILEASAGVKSKKQRSLLGQREIQHIEGGDELDERLTLMVYSQPPAKTQQPSKEKAITEEQENIFYVRIQIRKSMVNSIVNLGSQNNIISEALVQKLGMQIDKNPEPYQMGLQIDKHPELDPLVWLQKDARM